MGGFLKDQNLPAQGNLTFRAAPGYQPLSWDAPVTLIQLTMLPDLVGIIISIFQLRKQMLSKVTSRGRALMVSYREN